ncbi:MAG: ATP-binding protein [Pseudomonadota bacterium]
MTSIRSTLIKRFTLILIITFLFLLSAIAYINIETSKTNLTKTEQQIRDALIQKGSLLTFNNTQALQGLVEDNSFNSIRKLVSETVNLDSDIIYGIYMDNHKQAWAHADKNNPDGNVQKLKILNDPMARWSSQLIAASYRLHQLNNIEIYEFSAPIIVEHERLGSIRYGISTAAMKDTLKQALELSNKITIQSLLIIVGLGIISILASFFAIRRMAKKITQPLDKLTEATKQIANGDYDSAIAIKTNNEIGLLSHSFNNMRIKTKETLNQLLENQQQINEKNITLEITQNQLKDLNQNLEQKVLERTSELKEAQAKLLESARAAGVAEVAINVLHNIGNVLNSVNVINQTNYEIIKRSKTSALLKTSELLTFNADQIANYLSNDPRGKKIPELFIKLAVALKEENNSLEENTYRMLNSISMMTNIISTQQQYAKTDLLQENIQLSSILDEAINIQVNLIANYHVQLNRHYRKVADIYAEKAKVYQILNNLLVNAIQASKSDKKIRATIDLDIYQQKNTIVFEIKDNGVGIKEQDLTKVFQHGYTTKKTGHGFGLHSCANLMSEMHGEIQAISEGIGKGACFKLIFPILEESLKSKSKNKI